MIDPIPPQLPLALTQRPKPTGDIWEPSKTHPATVPVPLPVVMVRVDGPFTALDGVTCRFAQNCTVRGAS